MKPACVEGFLDLVAHHARLDGGEVVQALLNPADVILG